MRKLIAVSLLVAGPALADDPRKLAEDGWKAYQKHDLDKAETLTRQAIAATNETDIKAAALYNLGRVLEDRKDKAGAIAAYRQSLDVRHNGVVRDRLGTLDAAAAAAFDTFKPQPMQGPFAGTEAYCKKRLASEPADVQKELLPQCAAARGLKPRTAFKPTAPIQELKLVSLRQGSALLEVKVDGQWYVQELRPFEDFGNCSETAWKFRGVTAHGPALEVAYEAGGNCSVRETTVSWHERASTVVGIGASKKPSATPELRFEMTEEANGEQAINCVRKPTWAKDGSAVDIAIVKAADGLGGGAFDTEDIKGHHSLAFP